MKEGKLLKYVRSLSVKVTCNLLFAQSCDHSVLALLDLAESNGDRECPYFYK